MTQCEQYAINFMKPDICKFLVDEGAEVNFVEADRFDDFNDNGLSVFESTRNGMSVLLITLAQRGIVWELYTSMKTIQTFWH